MHLSMYIFTFTFVPTITGKLGIKMKTGLLQAQEVNHSAAQPEKYFREVLKVKIPEQGLLGTGLIVLPEYQYEATLCMEVLTKYIRQEGLELIEYHDLADSSSAPDTLSGYGEVQITQVFIKAELEPEVFEEKLGHIRKLAEYQIHHSKLKHRQSFSIGNLVARAIRKAS